MVGDGINDAPAITTGLKSSSFVPYAYKLADVGIAMGSGSDITISNAEFVLMSSSLMSILILIDLSRTVMRRIKFNFLWCAPHDLDRDFTDDKGCCI